jgi:hypothetical protein
LNWTSDYQTRLGQWVQLRRESADIDLESSLLKVNDWWQHTPWQPYYLHWDDHATWPGPWDLLADNTYCGLARALGIVYTLLLINHDGVTKIDLIDCDEGNLVQINEGKYILNWAQGEMLNIHSANITIKNTLNSSKIHHLLG